MASGERHLDPKVRELSIFFPAHNEVDNLERTVKGAIAAIERLEIADLEVIVVDDGSVDGTAEIADGMAASDARIRVVHHTTNRGYGAALKSGFAEASRDWVFYTDSDGQFDVADIHLLLAHAADHDAVVGYRTRRSDHAIRKLNQALWSRLVRRVLGIDSRDVDCAFKLIGRTSLERIGPLTSDGAVISAELLVKLARSGARVKQVGVPHHARIAGKPSGGDPRVIARAFRELFRLRWTLGSAARSDVRSDAELTQL